MTTISADRDFSSLHQVAAQLRQPFSRIEQACEALGISAAMRVNTVAYLDATQIDQVAQHIKEQGQ